MIDYEGMILAQQEDIYDGIVELDDYIKVSKFNMQTMLYETVCELEGIAAQKYMQEHGIN